MLGLPRKICTKIHGNKHKYAQNYVIIYAPPGFCPNRRRIGIGVSSSDKKKIIYICNIQFILISNIFFVFGFDRGKIRPLTSENFSPKMCPHRWPSNKWPIISSFQELKTIFLEIAKWVDPWNILTFQILKTIRPNFFNYAQIERRIAFPGFFL